MTRRDKLVQRFLQRPAHASIDDVRQVLEMHGWTHARTRVSPASFTRPGERTQVVPIHNGSVKRFCLDRLCELLGLGEQGETD